MKFSARAFVFLSCRYEGSNEPCDGGQEGSRSQLDLSYRGNRRYGKPSQYGKLLSDNPTLMRLRELEVLEKIASAGKLNIVLGEKELSDKVMNLL